MFSSSPTNRAKLSNQDLPEPLSLGRCHLIDFMLNTLGIRTDELRTSPDPPHQIDQKCAAALDSLAGDQEAGKIEGVPTSVDQVCAGSTKNNYVVM